jgi:hypothetical protein
MAFDMTSFMVGWGVGVVSGPVVRRLRPLLVELASAAGQLADSASTGLAQQGERLQDLVAEAKTAFQRSRPDARRRERAPRGDARRRRSSAPAARSRRAQGRGRRPASAPSPAPRSEAQA